MQTIYIILVILLQLGVIAGIFWMWYHFEKLRKMNNALQNRLSTDNLAIIQTARNKADTIITQANKHSVAIEQEAFSHEGDLEAIFNEEIEKLLKQHTNALVATSTSFGTIYEKALQKLEDDYLAHFKETAAAFNDKTEAALKAYEDGLQQQTVDLQKDTKEKVQTAYTTAMADIAAFKKIQMQQLQAHVSSITNGVVAKVLEEGLDKDKQEKIVIHAIEQMTPMGETEK